MQRMKEVCKNCGNTYHESDKYCRYCGAPNGSPNYIEEMIACIYGPMPEKRIHTCVKCGYSWDTMLMIDRECFCPKCGGSAPVSYGIKDDRNPVQTAGQFVCPKCGLYYHGTQKACPRCGSDRNDTGEIPVLPCDPVKQKEDKKDSFINRILNKIRN